MLEQTLGLHEDTEKRYRSQNSHTYKQSGKTKQNNNKSTEECSHSTCERKNNAHLRILSNMHSPIKMFGYKTAVYRRAERFTDT